MNWPDDIRIAVNLSPAQFKQQTLVHAVTSALANTGLRPSRLELEITESVLLANNETTMAILHQLRSLGVRIVMDDFGTGYSSLSYLRSFPFDKIKIDRSFVGEVGAARDCAAIVKAIAGLSGSLGIATTAEGVETEEQLGHLREHGCTEFQGFYFGRPSPLREASKLLRPKVASVA
jgi:EAL domain-containing protein (putative c-di-GMP-specific phosphodiesterase class I)